MIDRPEVSDRLIDRGVELWCRLLQRPVHDNGAFQQAQPDSDEIFNAITTQGMASLALKTALDDIDDYPAAIERFRKELGDILRYQRDHEGEDMDAETALIFFGEPRKNGDYGFTPKHLFSGHLDTDYNPTTELRAAAAKAGIPELAFSWKTRVNINRYQNSVSTNIGYAASTIYHYPLPDDQWLITDLSGGGDLEKVKAAALAGLIDLKIEKAQLLGP